MRWRRTSASTISDAAPAITTSPRSITTYSSISARAKSKYCSTSTIAMSPRRTQQTNDVADVGDYRRLNTFRRLVEKQQPGPCHKRAADGELLLLTAGQIPAPAAQHIPQHGNRSKISFGMNRSLRGRAENPVFRFSSTVSRERFRGPGARWRSRRRHDRMPPSG